MTAPSNPLKNEDEHEERSSERGSRSVRCPKCREVNTSGGSTCQSCGAHLYVSCRDCGERNPRSRSRCSACGRRLHRPFLQKILSRKIGRTARITPLQLILLVAAVAIGYKAIIFLVESLSQTHEGDSVSIQTVWRG
jgi:hypothetical protein